MLDIGNVINEMQAILQRSLAPFLRLEQALQEIEDAQGEYTSLLKKRDEVKKEVVDLTTVFQAKKDEAEAEIQKLKDDAVASIFRERKEFLAQIDAQKKETYGSLEAVRAECNAYIEQKKKLEEEAKSLRASFQDLERDLQSSFKNKKENLHAEMTKLQSDHARLLQKIEETERKNKEISAHHESLLKSFSHLKEKISNVGL